MIAPGGMRIPPGRAGRLWLERRLATAQHAGKLLTQKLAILNREEQRLVQRAEEWTGQWRVGLCPGVRDLDAARRRVIEPARPAAGLGRHDAQAESRWGSRSGSSILSAVWCNGSSKTCPVVGSVAVAQAAEAARAAVEAALSAAVATAALRTVQSRSWQPLAEPSELWSSGGYLGCRRRLRWFG